MDEEIKSFNNASTIARKVERNHKMFMDQILNNKQKVRFTKITLFLLFLFCYFKF